MRHQSSSGSTDAGDVGGASAGNDVPSASSAAVGCGEVVVTEGEAMETSAGHEQDEEMKDEEVVGFMFPQGFDGYSVEKQQTASLFHMAGFDAYQTGRIFAYYGAVLGKDRLVKGMNRVFLMGSAFELRLG